MRCLLLLITVLLTACVGRPFDSARATVPYPDELHAPAAVDIQVFREETDLVIVNATPRSYRNVRLWINQRYARTVDGLPAGGTIRLRLDGFHDVRGQAFRGGGFFSADQPQPVHLVQIQTAEDEPLVGLVTIDAESD